MKTVVMTGATSFLGRHLLLKLLQEGYYIYVFVRRNSKSLDIVNLDKRVRPIYGTLDDIEMILEYITSADYFVHFAWDGSGNIGRSNHDIQSKNIEYSMRALKVAERLNCCKFIFPGSQAEYGIVHEKIYESTHCEPKSEYGKAKFEFGKIAEEYCRFKNIMFIHMRIFSVYGFGDREGTLVDSCIRCFNGNKQLSLGPCKQIWNYLYIDDFVNIATAFINTDCEAGIYNVAGNDTRILRDFVSDIYEMSNKTGSYEFGNHNENPEGSPSLDPSIDKITKILNYNEMTTFRKGIVETMNFMIGDNEK